MRNCWEIKACPASHYMECSAYSQNKNCWDVKEGCICASYRGCEECPIYQEHASEQED